MTFPRSIPTTVPRPSDHGKKESHGLAQATRNVAQATSPTRKSRENPEISLGPKIATGEGMRYHLTTAVEGEGLDLSFVTTVTRLFMPGERPAEEAPSCFRPGQGAAPGKGDGAPVDDLAELVADGSVRLGQDIFLTEAEAKELERGKVPMRVQRAG